MGTLAAAGQIGGGKLDGSFLSHRHLNEEQRAVNPQSHEPEPGTRTSSQADPGPGCSIVKQ